MVDFNTALECIRKANPHRNIGGYIDTSNSTKFKDYYVFTTNDEFIDGCLLCIEKKTGLPGCIPIGEWLGELSTKSAIEL